MSMIQVKDCKTAAEVVENARRITALRRERHISVPSIPAPPAVVPAVPIVKARETVLPDAAEPKIRYPLIAEIVDLVAWFYHCAPIDVRSLRRTEGLVRPRHVACYLAKTKTLNSYPCIGRHLGGRDHTSILYASNKIERQRKNDTQLNDELNWLEGQLAG